jgi:hypothetical protein
MEQLVEKELAKETEVLGDTYPVPTSSATNPTVRDLRLNPSCQDFNRQPVSFWL